MTSLLSFHRKFIYFLTFVLVGCSSQPVKEQPPATPKPADTSVNVKVDKVQSLPVALTGLPLINSVLPLKLADREGWAKDIYAAFNALKIPPSKDNACAVVAVIAQESSFQVDPEVPELSKLVRRELSQRGEKYNIPQWVMDSSLDMRTKTGRTYNERIDSLKTEKDVHNLFDDIVSEIPFGEKLLSDYNPVHTVGPMQVSIAFADSFVTTRPYPYIIRETLHDELFRRRGGIYFGVAHLLAYPANYDGMIFRFADFNAGLYSSRNAAFQNVVSSVTGIPLIKDGDLLRYKNGVPLNDSTCLTMQALLTISSRLKMGTEDIHRDLLLEKSPAFYQTPLYKKVFALAPNYPKAIIPEIVLSSPKFSHNLKTTNYAKQLEKRFQLCLKK